MPIKDAARNSPELKAPVPHRDTPGCLQAVTVKERPILMSGPMVQAILAGWKTQTRRVIKPQPQAGSHLYTVGLSNADGKAWAVWDTDTLPKPPGNSAVCPYGKIGDHLWVRETYYLTPQLGNLYYKADNYCNDHDRIDPDFKWRPSIHMPRAASRLTLEITGIRAERVQDITEEDAIAEGVEESQSLPGAFRDYQYTDPDNPEAVLCASGCGSFHSLWDSINGDKPGYDWKSNPWVWCLSFNRVEEAEQ